MTDLNMKFDPRGTIDVVSAADKLAALRGLAEHRREPHCTHRLMPYLSPAEVLSIVDGQPAQCCQAFAAEVTP
jgi:hypothetical protein